MFEDFEITKLLAKHSSINILYKISSKLNQMVSQENDELN